MCLIFDLYRFWENLNFFRILCKLWTDLFVRIVVKQVDIKLSVNIFEKVMILYQYQFFDNRYDIISQNFYISVSGLLCTVDVNTVQND
jgi:hypothetical protein